MEAVRTIKMLEDLEEMVDTLYCNDFLGRREPEGFKMSLVPGRVLSYMNYNHLEG